MDTEFCYDFVPRVSEGRHCKTTANERLVEALVRITHQPSTRLELLIDSLSRHPARLSWNNPVGPEHDRTTNNHKSETLLLSPKVQEGSKYLLTA